MKKLVIMTVLAVATIAASATDVGLRAGRFGGLDTNVAGVTGGGITVGQQIGQFGAELSYDRGLMGKSSISRYGVVGSYPVYSYKNVAFAAKVGGAYIDPTVGPSGYAGILGVGISYPLTTKVNLVADYAYQLGQDNVKVFNGNVVTAGLKYKF